MRHPRRVAEHPNNDERWDCIWYCGKSYRTTSYRSIQRHAEQCAMRSLHLRGDVVAKGRTMKTSRLQRYTQQREPGPTLDSTGEEDSVLNNKEVSTAGRSAANRRGSVQIVTTLSPSAAVSSISMQETNVQSYSVLASICDHPENVTDLSMHAQWPPLASSVEMRNSTFSAREVVTDECETMLPLCTGESDDSISDSRTPPPASSAFASAHTSSPPLPPDWDSLPILLREYIERVGSFLLDACHRFG